MRFPVRVKFVGICADEWPGDDATDIQFIGQLARDFADVIEMLEAKSFFVGCDLDDTIGTCIDNWLATCHVLHAKLFNDDSAGGMLVSKNSGKFGLLDEFIRE